MTKKFPMVGVVQFLLCVVIAMVPFNAWGQQADDADVKEPKHVLWIIPNSRTSPTLEDYKPISDRQKLAIAKEDTFDRGTVALAATFAGINQLEDSDRTFGQGSRAFGRYFASSYTDLALGNYMTEGVFPILLHQDPRYFRKGSGSTFARFFYAAGQVLITHGDSGKTQINYSEIVGNSTAVAISQAYYPGTRTASDAAVSLVMQVGVDAFTNVIKEFWPQGKRQRR